MTDDIVNNGENLTPEIVINHPNRNVYKGVPKDYTGEDATSKNFMAVLKGDEKTLAGVGSGKVRYMEAWESGSMFENILPNNANVYTTMTANSEEFSYACYFDDKSDTYLGDSYSVHWMEDTDKEVLTTKTLQKQFKIVKETESRAGVWRYQHCPIVCE
ncbi:UNVERIFIED_CONTAM: Lgmn [Trichonephila clavipes]